jgi:hypothetical protein
VAICSYEFFGGMVDSTENLTTAPSPGSDLGEDVDPQTTAVLTLGARRAWTTSPVARTNLYRLRTGGGNEVWLPIHAVNSQVAQAGAAAPPLGSFAGLWVGEVIVDSVTTIVVDGEPVRKAVSKAPIRILLHSDASNAVSLLSQVTIMQTKGEEISDSDNDGFSDTVETAAGTDPADDEDFPADRSITGLQPQPVLVVDRARIPFFEGIKERNGKRVGLRLEAVAYDMPRKLDLNVQAALVAKAAAQVPAVAIADADDLLDYLGSRKLRPPDLEEEYHLTLLLAGDLGAGRTVQTTTTDPLRLDPFHRSNPFRHAFTQKHARGANISRELLIAFDAEQPIADRLAGSFSETLKGLTKSNLQLTGRVELRRVSAVDTLEGSE